MMQPDFDTIVVGAGVIGLAVARALALAGQNVVVLEKAARAGQETSSRNSEVIHAGIYYPSGSLKARFCVEGRNLLYDYCALNGVAAKRIGKLIVATSAQEEAKLQAIATLAAENGVGDLRWLSKSDVSKMEPEISCTRALFSPSTGIVDGAAFMLALQGEAENAGAVFAFNTRFSSAQSRDGVFTVNAIDANGDAAAITCNTIVNCAGHGGHDVALSIEGITPSSLPSRFFARGHYCSVTGKSPFRHLIYPVPVTGALGIHATLDQTGAVRFGPDIQWIDTLDYTLPNDLPEKFAIAVETYWPAVRERELTPSYSGIRPKIHGPDRGFADFHIQREDEHGVAGLFNLFGIESPGLTASLAIATYIQQKVTAS